MNNKVFKNIRGNKKYLYIVFFLVALFFLTGLITPFILKNLSSNWNDKVSEEITEIETSVVKIFNKKEQKLFVVTNSKLLFINLIHSLFETQPELCVK